MADFGFGSLVGKFEEYFGKRLTWVMMLLIGLAIAVTCADAIWSKALHPLVTIVLRAVSASSGWVILIQVAWIVAGGVIGIALASLMMTSFLRWHEARTYREMKKKIGEILDKAEALTERANAQAERAEAMTNEISANVAESRETLERLVQLANLREDDDLPEPSPPS